jgi:iron-sulfur cluster insertion protein
MALEITDGAAKRFRELSSPPDGFPRIEIAAGGCNGFEKKFTVDRRQDGDMEIDIGGGVVVLIDPVSHSMLANSVVGYRTDLQGSYFTIDIPEASSTCGCGISFSV